MANDDYSIFSSIQMISSARYSVYKNPAYALAELFDNSLDAKATRIELLCCDSKNYDTARKNIAMIGVLDNGHGMDEKRLRVSLRFGDGTGFKKGSKRLGRFGYGLPNASISQCARVEVYSWKKNSNNALYTYLDVDEMESGNMKEVPRPIKKTMPDVWKKAATRMPRQGTLVVWSNLDRCTWKTSKPLIAHSKFLIGRIYRKPIEDGSLSIRMVSFLENSSNTPDYEIKKLLPNDPLYLMRKSSTPPPWDNKPMFVQYGDKDMYPIEIKYKDRTEQVFVRYSIASNDARPGDQSGSTSYGKHARDNTGVSLIRECREIDLDDSLVDRSDTRERWWGAEIIFNSDLDDFFGITNDKQHANLFSDVAKNLRSITHNDKSQQAIIDEMEEDGDYLRASMARLIITIQSELAKMRSQIKISKEKTRKKRYSSSETKAVRDRQRKGNKGKSDEEEEKKLRPKIDRTKEKYKKEGFSDEEATRKAHDEVLYEDKFVWSENKLVGSNFFEVSSDDGKIRIDINTNHPAYQNLLAVASEIPNNISLEEAKNLLNRTYVGMRLLLASWARFEDETRDEEKLTALQDNRTDWGRVLRDFLKHNT